MYRVAQKLAPLFCMPLPNINRFSKLFYCQNQEKICNHKRFHHIHISTVSLIATLPYEMSSVLKARIEN